MPEFPTLSDNPDEIREFADHHPVADMAVDDLGVEIEYWRRMLEARRDIELTRTRNPIRIFERRFLRWGGVLIALAGLPACFLAPIIGFPIAVAGACLTIYDVSKQVRGDRSSRTSAAAVDVAVTRREALIDEVLRHHSAGLTR